MVQKLQDGKKVFCVYLSKLPLTDTYWPNNKGVLLSYTQSSFSRPSAFGPYIWVDSLVGGIFWLSMSSI